MQKNAKHVYAYIISYRTSILLI